jgi:MFS family permease
MAQANAPKLWTWLWQWPKAERKYRNLALRLGFLYFAELFSYQAYSLLAYDEGFEFLKGNDVVTLFLHFGMLLGALFWCFWILSPKRRSYGEVLRDSVVTYILALALLVALSWGISVGWWHLGRAQASWAYGFLRFFYGFGFSAGLALTVQFIATEYPRHLRTRAATLACAIGFAGPLVAGALSIFQLPGLWVLSCWGLVLGILSIVLLRDKFAKAWLGRPILGMAVPSKHRGRGIVARVLWEGKLSSLFWSCALMGVSISYFSDLLHLLPRFEAYEGDKVGLNSGFIFLWRYIGIAVGTVWVGWYSFRRESRKVVVVRWLWLQFLALVFLFLPPFLLHYGLADIREWGSFFGVFTGFSIAFSGFANASWVVNLLFSSEQFGRLHRAVALLLIINVYRFGSIGLIGLTLAHPEWFKDAPLAALGLGVVYLGIGWVAARQLPENFEGDGLEDNYDPSARPLSGADIRQEILGIPPKYWFSEAEEPFLREVSSILNRRLSNVLSDNYYLSALYFAQESDARLGSAGQYNLRGETYVLRGLEERGATDFHEKGEKMIANGTFASLALWLEQLNDMDGILLWFGAPGQYLDRKRLQDGTARGFRDFDLSSIQLPEDWAKYHAQIFDSPDEAQWARALTDLEQASRFDEAAWQQFWGAADDAPQARDIRRNLLFQRLEAEGRYRPGLLFVYYLKPHPTQYTHLRGILFLKMADQLGKNHLAELRDHLSWVLLQRAAALLQRSNENIIHEERHSNWHVLNALTARIRHIGYWFDELRTRSQKAHFEGLEAATFQQDFEPALQTLEHLCDLNAYYAIVTRLGHKTPSPEQEKAYKSLLRIEPIDLREALLQEVANMKRNPDIVALSDDFDETERQRSAEACLSNLEKSIHKSFENQFVSVIANKIALRVVLHELLKNAARHAHRHEPRIAVRWENPSAQRGGHAALHFLNNFNEHFGQDPDAQRRFVETIQDGIEHSARSLGVRSVRRFVSLAYFSTKTWTLGCEDPRSAPGMPIDIFLLIPHDAVQITTQP